MNKNFKYFTLSCVFLFLLTLILFFTLPDKLLLKAFPDPLAIIGYIFWIIALWATGAIFFGIYINVKNKALAVILSIISVLAFHIFIQAWFFSGPIHNFLFN